MNSRVSLYTLGCKLNFSESSSLARMVSEAGYNRVEFAEGADIYIINTCSVTDHADRKCRKLVQEAKKYNPAARIVITGCYAQLKPSEITEIPGVDMVLGTAEKFNLVSYLSQLENLNTPVIHHSPIKESQSFNPAWSQGDRTRTFLKVQDGCDYFCSFCTIPLARGKSRSSTIQEVLKQIDNIALHGVQEIVLTGVNLGDFGVDTGESFSDLVQAMEKHNGVTRYRISSIEPNLLTDEIIDTVSHSNKFMPHFHIPLQSGNDEILQKMRRRYSRSHYYNRIQKIRSNIPHASIGVDVITGFPGETDLHFKDTYQFLNEVEISYLHVFPYSERQQTGALKLEGKVPVNIRHERAAMLRNLSDRKKRNFYNLYTGSIREVLFENDTDGVNMEGFTDNYIRVEMPYDPLLIGEISRVKLIGLQQEGNQKAELAEIINYH